MNPFVQSIPLSALLLVLAPVASQSSTTAPHGRYVEARTASVFAGACHYGSEATTDGREALLAFQFAGGSRDGVDLTGTEVVVLVHGEANLADAKSARHSVLYVSQRGTPAARAALVATIEEQCRAVLGVVTGVRSVELDMDVGADRYDVCVKGLFELRGATLPDRACCKMPFNIWYRPFVSIDAPLVGLNSDFVCSDKSVGAVWSRPNENASFVGSFEFRPPAADAQAR